jgi:hypothetical protein
MKFAILTTDMDGTYGIYGPFSSESAAQSAQIIIDSYSTCDTQIIPMAKFDKKEFSIYS